MNRSYIYLSLRIFPIVRILVVGILAANLLSWVSDMWSPWITIGILLGFLGVMTLHLGVLRVVGTGESKRLIFLDLYRNISLPVPIQPQLLWTYSFNEGRDIADVDKAPQLSSRANDLHVYLILCGANNESVTLHEFIGIDSRFPNESEYAERIPNQGLIIEVQRTDRIFSFIQKHLNSDELDMKQGD